VRHNDNKFDYDNEGIANRKHIIADSIRYIVKESNNIDEASVLGIDVISYLEYENVEDFKQWILSLKPKDVRDEGISQQALYYQKSLIRNAKSLNIKQKVVRRLSKIYKQSKDVSKE